MKRFRKFQATLHPKEKFSEKFRRPYKHIFFTEIIRWVPLICDTFFNAFATEIMCITSEFVDLTSLQICVMIFTQFCKETERFLKFCYISPVFDSQTKSLHNTYCRLCLCCQRDRSRPRIINLTLLTLRIKERDERNLIKIESVDS